MMPVGAPGAEHGQSFADTHPEIPTSHFPAVPLGDGFKLTLLALDGLLCRGDAEIEARGALFGLCTGAYLVPTEIVGAS
jgi:hypothetical protein